MEKEGVQAAIDLVKYLLTLAGGAIAFVIQPAIYQTSLLIKVLSSFSVGLLLISIVAGLLVHSRGCVMLSKKNYNLDDLHLRVPGIVNQVSFASGFVFLCIIMAVKIWG